jgi:hypothetical protein
MAKDVCTSFFACCCTVICFDSVPALTVRVAVRVDTHGGFLIGGDAHPDGHDDDFSAGTDGDAFGVVLGREKCAVQYYFKIAVAVSLPDCLSGIIKSLDVSTV